MTFSNQFDLESEWTIVQHLKEGKKNNLPKTAD